MKLGVLFSGGKDSTYAAWLLKKEGHKLECLITIESINPDSFMFHTPAINLTKKQANCLDIPLIILKSKGEKELELEDLKKAIKQAINKYNIEAISTGAIQSVYQASRIQKICDELGIKCLNPLWKKNQIDLLNELINNKFELIISAVAAYPLDSSWVGRKVDLEFIRDVEKMSAKYKINPAGEGGEFESLVLNCPLFKKKLNVKLEKVLGENNSWRGIFRSE